MVGKYYNAMFLSFIVLVCIACKSDPPFVLPSGFKMMAHDSKFDEILRVKHNDDMQVSVTLSMSKLIKQSALFGAGPMKISFESKFPMIIQQYKGTNLSKQNHYFVNDNIYLNRSFDFTQSGIALYCEYGVMNIKEPEEYYEFYFTGPKAKQADHQLLIKEFLEVVK